MKWDLGIWLRRGPMSPNEGWAWGKTDLRVSPRPMNREIQAKIPVVQKLAENIISPEYGTDLLKALRPQEISRTWEQCKQPVGDSWHAWHSCTYQTNTRAGQVEEGIHANSLGLEDTNLERGKITNGLKFVLATSRQRATGIDGWIKITFLAWYLCLWTQKAPALQDWFRARIGVWGGGTEWNFLLYTHSQREESSWGIIGWSKSLFSKVKQREAKSLWEQTEK